MTSSLPSLSLPNAWQRLCCITSKRLATIASYKCKPITNSVNKSQARVLDESSGIIIHICLSIVISTASFVVHQKRVERKRKHESTKHSNDCLEVHVFQDVNTSWLSFPCSLLSIQLRLQIVLHKTCFTCSLAVVFLSQIRLPRSAGCNASLSFTWRSRDTLPFLFLHFFHVLHPSLVLSSWRKDIWSSYIFPSLYSTLFATKVVMMPEEKELQ